MHASTGPPGTDQTTRSPQRWNLLAPDLEEKLPFQIADPARWHHEDHLRAFLRHDGWSFNAFERLARRSNTTPLVPSSPTILPRDSSPIEELPAELIIAIFSDPTLTRRDIVALGACSRQLWTHAFQHVEADCRKAASPWAGTSLFLSGTYLVDLPPALYKARPDLRKKQRDWNSSPGGPLARSGKCPARSWNCGAIRTFHQPKFSNIKRQWRDVLATIFPDERSSVALHLRNHLNAILDPDLEFQGASGPWVLRNLTQSQYVRLEAVDDQIGDVKVYVADAPWLSVDKALLVRICWPIAGSIRHFLDEDEDNTGEGTPGRSKRLSGGVWAANKFDIVRPAAASLSDWLDVTTEVVREATAMMTSRRDVGVFGV